ncbi:MAG: Hsp20/alpha crystallin family protein [Planctomycetes bacterium]|nr:Hsp20/alpha crystallin family protein [Planctomycetota bacterium]
MLIEFQASEQSPGAFGAFFGRRESVSRGYYHFSQSPAWQPLVNVYEDEVRFHICVELAGLDKDEVAVEVVDQEIHISGERPVPVPSDPLNPECILRIEIDSGRFFRAIALPSQADLGSTTARLDRGFLWITVDKQAA